MNPLFEFILAHWALCSACVALVIAIIYVETSSTVKGIRLLSVQEMIQLINHEHAILIDIRDKNLHDKSHIGGAIHTDASALTLDKLNKLSKKEKKPVILHCQYGQTALKAASRLKKQGFKSIFILKGGFEAWKKENLPTKSSASI